MLMKMYLTMIIRQLITIINVMIKCHLGYQKPGKKKHNKLSIDWWSNFPKTMRKSTVYASQNKWKLKNVTNDHEL